MTKQELRNEYEKLLKLENIDYCKDVINRYLNFFMKVIWEHHNEPVSSQRMADAKIIFQMFFSKLLSLKNALDGISYQAQDGSFLKPIIDPTTLIPLVRGIYESVCAFEIIYIIPDTEEKKDIIYNLWVKAGLEYRQRFSSNLTEQELLDIAEAERLTIDILKNDIENTETYKALMRKEKVKLQNIMKSKDFKVLIQNNIIKQQGWQEISSLFGGTKINDIFKNMIIR